MGHRRWRLHRLRGRLSRGDPPHRHAADPTQERLKVLLSINRVDVPDLDGGTLDGILTLDPSLGNEQQFKGLIEEAHRRGIKVFLDVIAHGLMENSPVVSEHPNWFQGSSWGMSDFHWNGGHTDLDDWWVKIWTDYGTKYGADGFRLVAIYRPDIWERIRQNAASAGHPIIIFEGGNSATPRVADLTQSENGFSSEGGTPETGPKEVLERDVPPRSSCESH